MSGLLILLVAVLLPTPATAAPDWQVKPGIGKAGRIGGPAVAESLVTAQPGDPHCFGDNRRQQCTWGPVDMGPGEVWWASLSCPGGFRASGGGEINNSLDVALVNSQATGAPDNGWLVKVANRSGTSAQFTIVVACWSDLDNYSLQDRATVVGGKSSGSVETDYCPAPAGVVGGGGWSDTNNIRVQSSVGTSLTWGFGVRNRDRQATTIHAQVICGRQFGSTHPAQLWEHVNIDPWQSGSAFIGCKGSFPLLYGGGAFGEGITIGEVYPAGEAWFVRARNDTGVPTTLTAVAMCGG